MKKRHILFFYDELVRTSVFVFLCAMFLCGALAGGMTGLMASEGDVALRLADMGEVLSHQALRSILAALVWVLLPLVLALFRPSSLFLSALCAAKGFALAMTIAIVMGAGQGVALSVCTTGLPAVLSVPAILTCCTMAWKFADSGKNKGQLKKMLPPYLMSVGLGLMSALLRVCFATVLF